MLYVVGDGSLLSELKEQYKDASWVKFLGRIPYDELPDTFFNIVNYSLLPSLVYENSPGTVYDGFANSTPVVVPNLAGAPELVIDGQTGFVFAPGGHKGLIEALHKTVEYKDQYSWMAMKARTEIEKYSFDEYFKQIGIQ
jgi:glycosyltransferase involved in cell wall biosynthesis